MNEEYRDRTLDSFIAAWVAPPPDAQFHSRVRRAFDGEFVKVPLWRRWNGALLWRAGTSLCGGAAIGAIFLLTICLAFPQSAPFRMPWLQPSFTMDSEEIRYADDGTGTVERYLRTGPTAGGKDRVLWNYSPDHPYDNMFQRIVTQANYLLERITLPFFENTEQTNVSADPRAAYVKTGCVRGDNTISGDETVSGREILLGYSTTVIRWNFQQRRVTAWMAPRLGCRELKVTFEGQRADGSYQLFYERRVSAVVP